MIIRKNTLQEATDLNNRIQSWALTHIQNYSATQWSDIFTETTGTFAIYIEQRIYGALTSDEINSISSDSPKVAITPVANTFLRKNYETFLESKFSDKEMMHIMLLASPLFNNTKAQTLALWADTNAKAAVSGSTTFPNPPYSYLDVLAT
jgi:hypothetical protein